MSSAPNPVAQSQGCAQSQDFFLMGTLSHTHTRSRRQETNFGGTHAKCNLLLSPPKGALDPPAGRGHIRAALRDAGSLSLPPPSLLCSRLSFVRASERARAAAGACLAQAGERGGQGRGGGGGGAARAIFLLAMIIQLTEM